MLWNYKTFHFSPKMRQMMYPDCKTTLNVVYIGLLKKYTSSNKVFTALTLHLQLSFNSRQPVSAIAISTKNHAIT